MATTNSSTRLSTTSTSMESPAKPWEQRQTAATRSASNTALPVSRTTSSALSSADIGSSGSPAAISSSTLSQQSMMSPTTANDFGNSMTAYGGSSYGTNGYGNTIGSTYGTGGYGGYGGMSTYGGVSGYGGGYGGYGSTYGGYGGGYGGYGSMYGGYGRMGYGGGMMDPNGQMGWLSSFNHTVSSIGQITEMLGMNAEALNFCIGSFVHFVERIGAMCASMAASLTPRQPRQGEPPVTEEEEKSRRRRVRIFQCIVSMVAFTCLYKCLRWVTNLRNKTRRPLLTAPSANLNRSLENIFQNTMGRSTPILQ